MRNLLRPKDEATRIEAELPALEKRAAAVLKELGRIEGEAMDAAEARRKLIVEREDAEGSADLVKADKRCRDAADRLAAYREAARELGDLLQARREQLAGIHDRKQRERIADRLDARAIEIEKVATELDAAARRFAEVRGKLLEVMERSALSDGVHHPSTLMGPIVEAAVRLAAPGALPEDNRPLFGLSSPAGALEAATASQIGPLRNQAHGMRMGDLPPVEPSALPAPRPRVEFENTAVVLGRSISYHGLDGRIVQVCEGGVNIPGPVAEAAVKAGVGYAPQTEEAGAILADLKRSVPAGRKPLGPRLRPDGKPWVKRGDPDFQPIGVNLYGLAQAMREGRP